MTFKEAFRKARADGKKTFTWNGKSYTTQTAEEAAAVRSAPSSSPRPRARPTSSAPSRSPRPRPNPRSASTEDKKGNTGNATSARAQRAVIERRIARNENSLNIPRRMGAAVARAISDNRIATEDNPRPRRTRPRQNSAERYQRGATGPRR